MARWTVVLGLLSLPCGAPLRAAPPVPRAVIAQCALQVAARTRGLDALRAACPGVGRAVHALGLDSFLPSGWQTRLTARDLLDLSALAERYAARAPALRLDAPRLKSVALALRPPRAAPSWWERVKAWIERRLGPESARSQWLRFLSGWNWSPRVWRSLAVAVMTVALLAGALLALSIFRSVRGRRADPVARVDTRARRLSAPPDGEPTSGLPDFGGGTPRDQLARLLGALIQALTRSHRLGEDRNLTCRELCERARFDNARQRADFESVALLAERATYADPSGASAELPAQVASRARALIEELLAPRAGSASSAGSPRA